MTQFDKHWEAPVKINLRETQRFGQELQEVTTKFITSNPGQIQRELEGKGRLGGPAVHITQDDADTIIQRIQSTVSNQPDVLVLGRYKHSTKGIHPDWKSMTAHGSKGLEADYVIVQDLGVGRYGFPSEIEDDPIISLFLAESENFPNAEERRLFYVALTRAKKEVWLIPGSSGISPFIEELIENPKYSGLVTRDEESAQSGVKCPECSGRMIVRSKKSDGGKFLGCIYWPRCNGTLPGCPQCRKSIPLKKDGKLFCNNCDWSGPVFRRAK
jgi:DNA helicase-4